MKALFKSTVLTLICTFFVSFHVQADIESVEATIDRNPVMLDEAIRLTVTANGSADRDAFDSSSLLKDFVVGRTSVSSQTSIVNFDAKRTTTWTTTLFPRKEGTFTIPSLRIEDKTTTPIEVSVIPVQEQTNVARDYFVTTDIDKNEAYLNQQLLYTVKLHLSSNIERGSLQAPEMENAEIRQLGDDKQYADILNGRRYQIIERQFAVVPQASGEFTLRGPVFTGEVMAANTNQRFGFFNRTQQINRVGPDIVVNINPIPRDIDYPWLPSEMVRIDEEWPQGDNFVVGEPVTRIVTLTALGVVEEQLPEIPEFYPPTFKLYPDQSNTTTVEKNQNLIAQRQSSLAIIPTEPGKMVLPEVTIPWFNTLTEQTEYATIPPRSINVLAASGQTNSAPPQASPENETPSVAQAPSNAASDIKANEPKVAESSDTTTLWLLISVLALGWLVTLVVLVLFIKRSRQGSQMSENRRRLSTSGVLKHQHNSSVEKKAYKTLISILKAKDISQIDSALQVWLRALNGNESGRPMPEDSSDTVAIRRPLDKLQQARFSKSNDGKSTDSINQILSELMSEVEAARKAHFMHAKSKGATLSKLYPTSSVNSVSE
ncbi:protein BatD [Alteromonas genovensis]|uniref:Protein BatD n=1 Tax=Alteromonas genovensis TaxID=471225 RepID=A0A6N9TC31_9ALTE|nr:BatD family protein [Alteromonas genovensis]NDW14843.1 protein BatD [Alteromonas genovensis]